MNLAVLLALLVTFLGGGAQRGAPHTPEEVARIERLRGEFERLEPEARRKLLARAHALRERERQLERELSPELRRRFEEGDPAECRRLWRQHVKERYRQSGKQLFERLPPDLRRQLEQATPEERRALLERILSDPDGLGARLSRRLCERLGVPPGERRRYEELKPVERLRRLHELDREQRRKRRGRP